MELEKKITLEDYIKEQNAITAALAKPMKKVLQIDSLLGPEVEGHEGIYWYTLAEDETDCGMLVSGTGVRIPKTVHIPTGSNVSYRKIYKVIDGKKTPVWEVHQKDLAINCHEPYDNIS